MRVNFYDFMVYVCVRVFVVLNQLNEQFLNDNREASLDDDDDAVWKYVVKVNRRKKKCGEGIIDTQSHFAYHDQHWMLLVVLAGCCLFFFFFVFVFALALLLFFLLGRTVVGVCVCVRARACVSVYILNRFGAHMAIVEHDISFLMLSHFRLVGRWSCRSIKTWFSRTKRNCRSHTPDRAVEPCSMNSPSASVLACVQIKRCEFLHITNWKCFVFVHNVSLFI